VGERDQFQSKKPPLYSVGKTSVALDHRPNVERQLRQIWGFLTDLTVSGHSGCRAELGLHGAEPRCCSEAYRPYYYREVLRDFGRPGVGDSVSSDRLGSGYNFCGCGTSYNSDYSFSSAFSRKAKAHYRRHRDGLCALAPTISHPSDVRWQVLGPRCRTDRRNLDIN